MIYRVEYWNDMECSQGFEFFGTIKAAKKAAAEFNRSDSNNAKIEPIKTPKTKKQILAMLNVYATHCDNG